MADAASGRDREGRMRIIMERAQTDIVHAAFFERHELRHTSTMLVASMIRAMVGLSIILFQFLFHSVGLLLCCGTCCGIHIMGIGLAVISVCLALRVAEHQRVFLHIDE